MVWAAAVVAFLARFPSLLWPLRPDEAGFLMVARAWQPEPDSLYGRYWVDRPPPIIWLVQATDRIGGPYAHRLLGALACSLLVLAAAAAAREVAVRAGVLDPAAVRRLAGWVAVATAALVSNAEIDRSPPRAALRHPARDGVVLAGAAGRAPRLTARRVPRGLLGCWPSG